MEFVIGIDIGTTHCKAIAISPEGKLLQQWQSGYPTIQELEGQSEQEPELVFHAVLNLLKESCQAFKKDRKLIAVGFSAAMHSILAIDENGKPLTNAFTWADNRSEVYALKLKTEGKQDLLYPRTGVPIHPMLPLCKIIWMREKMADVFKRAKKFISLKEYVFFKLFGNYIVDYSIAAASGLFDIINLEWSNDALKEAGIDGSKLSKVVSTKYSETKLTDEYRKAIGISADIPFFIGGSDGCLANIGSGAVSEGEGAVTIGTSGAIRIVATKANPDPLQRLFNYPVEKDLYVCGGPVNNGGIVIKWFAENFLSRNISSTDDFNWLMEEAGKVNPGANGLLFLPFLLGERAPYWDSSLRASFTGLDINHRKEHMIRAVVEGVCFGLCSVMKATETSYGSIKTLYASGGFTQSKLWMQILADILGKTIHIAGEGDASARGAAVLALYANGNINDLRVAKEMVVDQFMIQPNKSNHELYLKQFMRFEEMVAKIK